MVRLPHPQTAPQAVWMARGLWLLAIISLGLPWLWLEPEHLKSVYSDSGLNWPLLIAILLVSGFIQCLIALAVRYTEEVME